MALRSHSLALSDSAVYCFCSFFSSAIATATAFLASTSCCCISSSTWDSIFSGSSAFVMRSLMLDLISVPSLEKIPMASFERTGSKVWLQRSLRACYWRCFATRRSAKRDVTRAVRERGIEAMTLYAFSSQNWQRPVEEVAGLMELLREYLIGERAEILDNAIRLDAIGDGERLPPPGKEPPDEPRTGA